jgi:hypothetical protein
MEILVATHRVQIGQALLPGLSIVILATVLDRITQGMIRKEQVEDRDEIQYEEGKEGKAFFKEAFLKIKEALNKRNAQGTEPIGGGWGIGRHAANYEPSRFPHYARTSEAPGPLSLPTKTQ